MSAAVTLAGLDRPVSPLGLGTWAWGDRAVWGMGGYDAALTEATIRDAWEASIDAGVTFVDTAEVYGNGESERIIGRLLAADPARRERVVVATKFMPMPWKVDVVRSMRAALEASLDRLGIDAVDLYQVHGPISLRGHSAMAEALATVHAAGLTRAVGVSNYSARETKAIHAALARRGVALATNQIEYSLLRRRPETTGAVDECRRLGVTVLAYSPLGQGRLTGKYSTSSPPQGQRGFSAHPMADVDPVVARLRDLRARHDGATPGQVALAWLIAKGTVPIPGAKNGEQASANAAALRIDLTAEDVASLDAVALDGLRSVRNRFWQHG